MKTKGKYMLNTNPCLTREVEGTPITHIWSNAEDDLVKLCLICYQPKMLARV